MPSYTRSNKYLLALAVLGAANKIRPVSQMGCLSFVGGYEFGDQYAFDMPERLQPFPDCNQLARKRKLLPVALLFAEDRVMLNVRYSIDDYSDRANDVQLNHGTP